jgi:nucleoside-diphosphate-sugar epimerase
MKILVTGAAGYLGSVLCELLLDEGHEVMALDNLMYGQSCPLHLCANKRFDFVLGDVRDEKLVASLLKRVDAVIPLACIVGAPASDRDPTLARAVNFEAIRMLNRLRSRQQLVVYPTTNSGYGTKSGDQFCTESTPLEPISLYGQTKVDAEKELLDGGGAITLRLATVFGLSPRPRLDLLVNHFVWAAVTDGYLVVFEKHFKRNYVHIRDVADCMHFALTHAEKMAGRPFNVGLDEANLSKEELALKVKSHVPRFYVHFAEIGTDPDKRNYIVSNQRLREAGFVAKRSIDDGIVELLKGYQGLSRNHLGNA